MERITTATESRLDDSAQRLSRMRNRRGGLNVDRRTLSRSQGSATYGTRAAFGTPSSFQRVKGVLLYKSNSIRVINRWFNYDAMQH